MLLFSCTGATFHKNTIAVLTRFIIMKKQYFVSLCCILNRTFSVGGGARIIFASGAGDPSYTIGKRYKNGLPKKVYEFFVFNFKVTYAYDYLHSKLYEQLLYYKLNKPGLKRIAATNNAVSVSFSCRAANFLANFNLADISVYPKPN